MAPLMPTRSACTCTCYLKRANKVRSIIYALKTLQPVQTQRTTCMRSYFKFQNLFRILHQSPIKLISSGLQGRQWIPTVWECTSGISSSSFHPPPPTWNMAGIILFAHPTDVVLHFQKTNPHQKLQRLNSSLSSASLCAF